jgi:hypothetical protein
MQRPLLVMITVALGSAACLPPAEDAGQVDPTESDGTDGEATSTSAGDESSGNDGAPPVDAAFEWTLELEPDLFVVGMVRTPDGILVSFQSDPSLPEPYAEVREYSSSMELLWSQPLPSASVWELEVLGDGEFMVAGLSGESGSFQPTVWRLSCCSEMTSQTYPHESEYPWVTGADLHEDGLLLAINVDTGIEPWATETTFLQIPLELGPATELGTASIDVRQTARASSGVVVLLVTGGNVSDSLSELGPGGPDGHSYGIGQRMVLVGKGDELTVMSLLEDEVQIQPFGGRDGLIDGEWVSVSTPGFAAYYDTFVVDRHERVVLVHHEDEPDGSNLSLVEFDDDGVVARSLIIPHLHAFASSTAVAVGEDDAIYVAVSESDLEGSSAQYIHRIAAL